MYDKKLIVRENIFLIFEYLVLVEMDGLESKTNVIMLASTNRPDVLDKVKFIFGKIFFIKYIFSGITSTRSI